MNNHISLKSIVTNESYELPTGLKNKIGKFSNFSQLNSTEGREIIHGILANMGIESDFNSLNKLLNFLKKLDY